MLASYVIGVALTVAVLLAWVAIQSAWARAFSDPAADPDALARRMDCHGCGCAAPCPLRSLDRHPQENQS